mmetsp:Transcript_14765/g.44610  ORF Transcript_14765/g.44610 Transcript_14765/m.44610 type:complete len:178 (+) Transcript_14765:270-803(+)
MPPQQSAQPISKTRRGPQINLCWALDLLQRIPGPHQQRIVSQSAAKESPSDGDAIYPDRVVMSKEELGRSTWTFLHSLAAQWPERPSKQQKKDAHSLVDVLTRIYPCAACAQHFGELVKRSPPKVDSQADFELWMCDAHNQVNTSIGKPVFNCKVAGLRWPSVQCDPAEPCVLGQRR